MYNGSQGRDISTAGFVGFRGNGCLSAVGDKTEDSVAGNNVDQRRGCRSCGVDAETWGGDREHGGRSIHAAHDERGTRGSRFVPNADGQ